MRIQFLGTHVVWLLLALSGCSNTQGLYEGVRRGARNECERMPETERTRCLERTQDDYDTYEEKLEQARERK